MPCAYGGGVRRDRLLSVGHRGVNEEGHLSIESSRAALDAADPYVSYKLVRNASVGVDAVVTVSVMAASSFRSAIVRTVFVRILLPPEVSVVAVQTELLPVATNSSRRTVIPLLQPSAPPGLARARQGHK